MSYSNCAARVPSEVTIPLDRLDALAGELRGLNIGLITNHTGVNRKLEPAASVLSRLHDVRVLRLFSPEHGIYGDALAGEQVANSVDPRTGLPVFSLYGTSCGPRQEWLEGLDALVVDIQDLGVRYFTYIWTVAKCMEASAERHIPFIVLDRPNPINGQTVEGNVSKREFASLVGLYPIAARHGLTIGEVAQYINGEFGIGADLRVIKLVGWRRSMWYDDTGLVWVPLSPNSTGLDMATLYAGTCLLEGTNLSEGRGTTKPFEILGAPWIDPFGLADRLNDLRLPGVLFRPAYFMPQASKYAGTRCGGVQVHVVDREAVRSFELGLWLIYVVRSNYPEFQWRSDNRGHTIDRLAGTDELRLAFDEGLTPGELLSRWSQEIKDFVEVSRRYLLYR